MRIVVASGVKWRNFAQWRRSPNARTRTVPQPGRHKCESKGYPARTASHKTERAAKRWAVTIEASMHEGRHFRGAAAHSRRCDQAVYRRVSRQRLRAAQILV